MCILCLLAWAGFFYLLRNKFKDPKILVPSYRLQKIKNDQTWTEHERNMNETSTTDKRTFLLDVRERNSWSRVLSFIVHERIRACFVHIRFVHERFLPISLLSFVFGRTNETPHFFPFMFIVRSSLDKRPFVRLGCGIFGPTAQCPIICMFCGITILRFTFYTQNDETGNFTEIFISIASVFHQNLITYSDSAHFLKLDCLFRYFLTFPHFGIFRSPGTEK